LVLRGMRNEHDFTQNGPCGPVLNVEDHGRHIFVAGRRSVYKGAIPVLSLLLFVFFSLIPGAGPAEAYGETSQVKSEFLCNFAKFVEWPSSSFGPRSNQFHICILGDDPFDGALETIQDKRIQGKKPKIRYVKKIQSIMPCHLLFISASEQNQLTQILDTISDLNVLTISDMRRFAERGGMISLLWEENRVTFEVNFDALTGAGLKISSQLLRLAKTIYISVQ